MAIWANANNIPWLVWTIVGRAKWLDVMRFGVWRSVTKDNSSGTDLACVVHISFDPTGKRCVAKYTIG